MTKISYYILGDETLDARTRFAVKFVRQSWRKGQQIHCHVANSKDAELLDHMLWADDQSFIPHAVQDNKSGTPAKTVGIGWTHPRGQFGMLINLSGPLPQWFSHFEHLVEIVVQVPEVLANTRANWKQLKFNGYSITQHDLRS